MQIKLFGSGYFIERGGKNGRLKYSILLLVLE